MEQIYPLAFKPGIRRDGTEFQGDYCTDGQWIRFQRGMVRKMGGMIALNQNLDITATSMFLLARNTNEIYMYYVEYEQQKILIKVLVMDSKMNITSESALLKTVDNVGTYNVQIMQIYNFIEDRKEILFLLTPNKQDIAQNQYAAYLYSHPAFASHTIGQPINLTLNNGKILPGTGGMCYSAPYVFFYGGDGKVFYGEPNNPLKLSLDREISLIVSDKVIFGAPIRGGATAPTLLFWTLSSVVRVSNVSAESVTPVFKADIISQTCSIISSRCVVEYDGLYFWMGTERFYFYNGIVQPVVNNTSFNYFYNKIDMEYRQNVFGLRNPHYNEIWWFCPTKGSNGKCNYAIIYNIQENSWYDTSVNNATCGFFLSANGKMYVISDQITNPTNDQAFLWNYTDTTVNQIGFNSNQNNLVELPIYSFFTTPVISWASFNPLKQFTGVDRWIVIKRFEPDFVRELPFGPIKMQIQTKKYASDIWENVAHGNVNIAEDIKKIDFLVQGRQMRFIFSSENFFEMGHCLMLLSVGDGQ